jgi:hypothetical protein
MKRFIAVVKSTGGVLDKYQDFDLEADANAHVVAYGGYVASSPGGDTKFWIYDSVAKTITHDAAAEEADRVDRAAKAVQKNRRAAYQTESDPLFFQEQRGEVPAGTWEAKVAEIKVEYPKPE